MSDVETVGEWREERLYVLRTLEDLKSAAKHLGETQAAERAALLEKAVKDINVAHSRIRVLEESRSTLRMKNWLMSAVLSGIGVLLFEIVKGLLHGAKP